MHQVTITPRHTHIGLILLMRQITPDSANALDSTLLTVASPVQIPLVQITPNTSTVDLSTYSTSIANTSISDTSFLHINNHNTGPHINTFSIVSTR